MFDSKKRRSLKVLGGTAVVATVPSLALAKSGMSHPFDSEPTAQTESVVSVGNKAELGLSLSIDPVPTLTLANRTDKPIVVRHVHPGIVHAGEKAFDLNEIFANGELAVPAGSSREFSVHPIVNTAAETAFPRERYRGKPLRVAALRGTDRHGEVVNSSRSFYS